MDRRHAANIRPQRSERLDAGEVAYEPTLVLQVAVAYLWREQTLYSGMHLRRALQDIHPSVRLHVETTRSLFQAKLRKFDIK